MDKNKAISILFLLYFFSAIPVSAQFSVEAELRPRFQLNNGYKELSEKGSTPSAHISQRSRLSFHYEKEQIRCRVTLQDVRVWGDELVSGSTAVYGDHASLDLHEAYCEVKALEWAWISIGRQKLAYDNERLLANRNWNQHGIAYDAFVFKSSIKDWQVHAGATWNTFNESKTDNYYPSNRIKTLNFLHIQNPKKEGCNYSFIHLATGVTENDTSNRLFFRHSSGMYITYTKEHLKISGDGYYQYGKNNSNKRVSAYMLNADLFVKPCAFSFGAGMSYLSGNRDIPDSKDNMFDLLYGARHRFYGEMDYFSSPEKNTMGAGLADYYFYMQYSPVKTLKITNTTHYFALAEKRKSISNNSNLGYENDLVMHVNTENKINIKLGYLIYMPTETCKTIQNKNQGKTAHFLYLELGFKPVLFKQ